MITLSAFPLPFPQTLNPPLPFHRESGGDSKWDPDTGRLCLGSLGDALWQVSDPLRT